MNTHTHTRVCICVCMCVWSYGVAAVNKYSTCEWLILAFTLLLSTLMGGFTS